MSIQLTEEQQLIGQSAREFAQAYLEPIAADMDRTGAFPAEAVRQLAAHDFLGLFLPGEHGGADAGFVSFVEVVETLSRTSAATASILVNHAMAAYAIHRWGDAAQHRAFLPALASGASLGAFAVYEHGPTPGVGPDALQATRVPGGWVLKGTKAFVRNAGEAQVLVVAACADPAAGAKGLAAFIVRAGAPGLTVAAPAETMGLRGCPVADLRFDDVLVPDGDLLGKAGDGGTLVEETLAMASVAEAAQTVGLGQAAVEHAAAYARTRVQFGRPIAALQAIQTLLAETATDCHLARLGLRDAAERLESGEPFLVEAAMVKTFLARVGSRMLIDTVQVEGGFGYSEFMPLPRLFRDIAGTTLLEAPAQFPDGTIAAALLA
ncbi:acyl-CoA dehydrogenase family protein [Mesoterricola silvestris]|uniref:Acyl-CoA dehydrogenase n=1 Tax=Mesoterricola silvestris TaxID=2927979 RepID=A0AA48GZK6_9BACT|nr:acyl-CoA dehydrogenase family protein [Mesoterricola silvestris]BDU73273.1 acyl-CoA dehydrogenase [Mesoterricola silvestris]